MKKLDVFGKEIDTLLRKGQTEAAEERMLKARAELEAEGNTKELDYIVQRLAQFHSMPGTENLEKAEAYFQLWEKLSPGAYSKYQTAMFYFYVLGDHYKTIGKVDEIRLSDSDLASYFSALTLKGQASISLKRIEEAEAVIDKLLRSADRDTQEFPFGDEINLIKACIAVEELVPKCRKLLELVIPKMRDKEFQRQGKKLLKLCNA